MKKRYLVVLILLILIIAGFIGVKNMQSNLESLKDLEIANIDISKIDDGTYTGSCQVFPISVEVEVTINNHQITGVNLLKHQNGQGAPAEAILDKVVDAQTLQVDIVSGATYSSIVILRAIENSLNNAIKIAGN